MSGEIITQGEIDELHRLLNNNPDAVLEEGKRLLNKLGDTRNARYLNVVNAIAAALTGHGDYDEAEKYLLQGLEFSENPHLLNTLAVCYNHSGRHEEGLERINRAIAINASIAPYYQTKLLLLIDLQKHEEALKLIDDALFQPQFDYFSAFYRGIIYQNDSKFEEAINWFEKAIKLQPGARESYFALSHLLLRAGEPERARQVLKELEATGHLSDMMFADLASTARFCGDPDDAITCAKRALEINPSNITATLTLAALRADNDDYAAATDMLKELLEKVDGPDRAGINYTLARYQEVLGQNDESFDNYRRANILLFNQYDEAPDAEAQLKGFLAEQRERFNRESPVDTTDAKKRFLFVVGPPESGVEQLTLCLESIEGATVYQSDTDLAGIFLTKDSPEERRKQLDEMVKNDDLIIISSASNILMLPAIQRVVPEAELILCARHPKDIIMSCFAKEFAITETTLMFLKWESTIELIRVMLNDWFDYSTVFDKKPILVSYEKLTRDTQATFDELARELSLTSSNLEDDIIENIGNGSATLGRWRGFESRYQDYARTIDSFSARLGYTDL